MKTLFRNMASRLFTLLAAFALAFAQGGAQAQPAYSFSQQELDQMLAPIALYPDAMLSQVLMAATYPLEVAEAARWAADRPELSGDAAVRAAETEDWDPSVKSLVAFPQVLAQMGQNQQWTQSLGDAFLDQQSQVMDTVQSLRRKAQAAGNLRSDDRVSVVESGPSLLVQSSDPQVVYVPYYDPQVVYGSWWWPAYPPVYFRPWPGYYAQPAYAGGFYWGSPVAISAGFFFGDIDWRRRHVRVAHVNNYYYNRTWRRGNVSPQVRENRPGAWRHDPDHRRGLTYRGADAQRRFGAASGSPDRGNQARAADARRSDRGMDARPDARFDGRRPDARFDGRRPDARFGAEARPNPQPAPAAPIETRSDGRLRDARPGAEARPNPQPALAAPIETRIDGRLRDARPGAEARPNPQPAPAAPIERRSDGRLRDARPGAETRPNPQPAPAAPIERRSDGRLRDARPGAEARPNPQPAPAAALARAVNTNRVESRPEARIRPEWNARAARNEPSARVEVPRAPQPRMDFRPVQSAARQQIPVARHQPAARNEVPRAVAPRAEIRSPRAAARQETRANDHPRWRTAQ